MFALAYSAPAIRFPRCLKTGNVKQAFKNRPGIHRLDRLKQRPVTERNRVRKPLTHAGDDDDILPVWSGRVEKVDPATLPRATKLGGKTVGEELELIHQAHEQAEKQAVEAMRKNLHSSNWEGDVYVGSNWNTLTAMAFLMFVVPVVGLIFAYFTYGSLWGVEPYY